MEHMLELVPVPAEHQHFRESLQQPEQPLAIRRAEGLALGGSVEQRDVHHHHQQAVRGQRRQPGFKELELVPAQSARVPAASFRPVNHVVQADEHRLRLLPRERVWPVGRTE